MPITPAVVEAINNQIQAEFQSAYQYLAMSAWFHENNLPGCAHWMNIQWQEETAHAMKLFGYVHDRGGAVTLQAITAPEHTYASPLDVFRAVREHEAWITSRITELYDIAVAHRDLPLQIMLQWFISEQVEEEAVVDSIIERLQMIGGDGPSIYLLDRELGGRPGGDAVHSSTAEQH
ncbi:MAG: ferritin [Candidatus Kapaibacteriota bacterium]|jgi:ferritin